MLPRSWRARRQKFRVGESEKLRSHPVVRHPQLLREIRGIDHAVQALLNGNSYLRPITVPEQGL